MSAITSPQLKRLQGEVEYLVDICGAAGVLAQTMQSCYSTSDGLTKPMDALLGGPDATDAFDASCNTCAHFQRNKFDRKERLVSVWGFPGHCAKNGKSVVGWPRGIFCGHACYENRRTGSPRTSKGIFESETEHFANPFCPCTEHKPPFCTCAESGL